MLNNKLTYACGAFHVLTIAYLLWLTLLPVEVRWAEADFLLLCGSMAFAIVGLGISLYRKALQSVTLTDVIVFLWLVYFVGRAYVGGEYACATEILKSVSMGAAYFSLRMLLYNTRLPGWMLALGIIVCGSYESLLGIYQVISGTSLHPQYLLTGSFPNPGPYSAYPMLALVVGIVTLFTRKDICNKHRNALLAMLLPVLIVLPMTWSRAAFVSIALVLLWVWRRYYWRYRYAVWGMMVVAAIMLYVVKQGSADGRVIIWRAAIAACHDNVWLGVGIGGFRNAVAEGMEVLHGEGVDLSGAGVTDYAYNAAVKILTEQGIIGLSLVVAATVVAMMRLRCNSQPLYCGMFAVLLFAMFSYPFELLPYNILLVLVMAWSESMGGTIIYRCGRVMTVAAVVVLVLLSCKVSLVISERYEHDRDYDFIRGMRDEAFIKDYNELLPYEKDNAEFLFDFGKMLRVQHRYNDSNAMLRQGSRHSADPMFHVLMGNNYNDMRQYRLAEQSYRKAFAIMPNRIYPLYQLMLLYEETGDSVKMSAMAQRVLRTKCKVESPATREMKEKAKERLTIKERRLKMRK